MPLLPFKGITPSSDPSAFIAPSAYITGDVSISKNVSILFGAVIRGDLEKIIIGERSNIQDNSVIHTSLGVSPCIIGNSVTVGHSAILHSCTIEDSVLIGMGAIILDKTIIGEGSIIGAGSLVTIGTVIPQRSLALGSPAKIIRTVTEDEYKNTQLIAERYVSVGKEYKKSGS